MTPTFITLPIGVRINTAHLIHFQQSEHPEQIALVLTDEPTPWLENMTLEELDLLLRPPAITNFILDLRLPKQGDAVMFHLNGQDKHGVVEKVDRGDNQSYTIVDISSGGEMFRYWPDSGDTIKI